MKPPFGANIYQALVFHFVAYLMEKAASMISASPAPLNGDAAESTLAKMWEENRHIRNRLRQEGALVIWPKPELIGHPNMAAIALNSYPLQVLAKWWCPQQGSPKSPSVRALKREVGC